MDQIIVSQEQWLTMRDDVIERYPEEACGILGGINEEVLEVVPVTNILHSPVRYRMDPQEQYDAMREIEDRGHRVLGIYHSHINGPEGPSVTDLREASYPEAAYLVWSPRDEEWQCKAFMIHDFKEREIPLSIEG